MSDSVLICGSMAFDTIAVFEGRFKEQIVAERIHALSVSFLVPSMRKEYGGCAGNIAYNLKLLGGNPLPVATIGEDANDYVEYLRRLGIDTSGLMVVPGAFTAQCFITTDLDDNQIAAFHPGAMAYSSQNQASARPGALAIVAPDSKEGMFAHAERLHAQGIPFIFDLGQAMPLFEREDLTRMLSLAQVLTVNDYEASVVEQRMGRSMAQIAQGLHAAVVTRGAEGAILYTEGTQTPISAACADAVVDPTGCGDAYRAGLLYARLCGWSWADSCRLASVMGAIKVASRGPQNHTPTRSDIATRLQTAFGLTLPPA